MNSLVKHLTILLMLLTKGLDAKKTMINIFWNTTNPMFRIDNTDNIFDINKGNQAWEYDQANIICPVYPEGTREADKERYVIYIVGREGYEKCRVGSGNVKVIAVCNQPDELKYYTITFRSFTPTPGGLEFKPGEQYYFISTSSRHDLFGRVGGRCSSNNMRVQFNVAPVDYPDPHPGPGQSVNLPRRNPSLVDPDDEEFPYPVQHEVSDIDSNSVEHRKRSHELHPGEVVKQASVMGPSSSSSSSSSTSSRWSSSSSVVVLVSLIVCLCSSSRTCKEIARWRSRITRGFCSPHLRFIQITQSQMKLELFFSEWCHIFTNVVF